MNIAFLVIAHRDPQQLRRLCRVLTAEGDSVFVHIDKGVDIRPFRAALADIQDVHISQKVKICWGGYSMIRATNHLIDRAMADGRFDYFMLLSGQCFPMKPISWLKRRLADFPGDHINIVPMPCPELDKDMDRIERYYFEGRNHHALHYRLLNRLARWLVPARKFEKVLGLRPHAGSQWWCLTRESIEHIRGYLKANPGFDRFMRHAYIPDEIYYHTILAGCAAPPMRYPALFRAEFDRATFHPKTFGPRDLPMLGDRETFLIRKASWELAELLEEQIEKEYVAAPLP